MEGRQSVLCKEQGRQTDLLVKGSVLAECCNFLVKHFLLEWKRNFTPLSEVLAETPKTGGSRAEVGWAGLQSPPFIFTDIVLLWV